MRSKLSTTGAAIALILAVHSAFAADAGDKRLAQAREMARQAQAALQQAMQERDLLRQQQAGAEAEKAELGERLAHTQADARAAQVREKRQAEALQQAETELAQLRQALADEQARRQRVEAAAAEELVQARQALQDQRRVTSSVTALLQKSVAALARAEDANRSLHQLGMQAVEAYTQRTPGAMLARSEPFLALGTVKLQDEAETLRKAMDAQRVAP